MTERMTRAEFWADVKEQIDEDPILAAMTLSEFFEYRAAIEESKKALEGIFRTKDHVCHERDSCLECEARYEREYPMETD